MTGGMRYVNHLGEAVDLRGASSAASDSQLDDWEWGYGTLNGRASGFARKQRTATVQVAVGALDAQAGAALLDRIYEVAEKDALAERRGRLYAGGWYLECCVVASGKSLHRLHPGRAVLELTLLMDDPAWTMEHLASFSKGGASGGANYPHGFPYDFGSSLLSKVVVNPGFAPAPAKLTVYGPADKPRVAIGGNAYAADAAVPAGGRLEIDGASRTVTLYDAYGNAQNAFHTRRGTQRRGSGSYAFEPVPAGASAVTWDGSFAFDVTLYERRAERRWGA